MTREERIEAFGAAQKAAKLAEVERKENMVSDAKFQMFACQNRVNNLLRLAKLCKENGVPLGEEQSNLCSKGIETNCFISNGWSHRLGFNNELNAIGFYNGGANGEVDMWLYWNGEHICPTERYHKMVDGVIKWVKEFPAFEEAFLKYIDELGE